MKRRRKKILGLPIGPPEPSLAQRLVKPGIALAGAGAIAFVSTRVRRRRNRNHGDPSVEARSARANLQRELKTGNLDLEEAFARADRDEALARTRVKVLLQSLPGVGPRGALNTMEELGIDPSRRVRGLGSRQRTELLERFGHRNGEQAQDA